MTKRTSDLFPVVIGGGVILLALFLHSIYEDLLKAAVLKRLSAFMEMPEAELVSRLAEMAVPIIGAVAIIWIVLRYVRRELRAEMPDPLIEVQRQHTAAILAQTEAWKSGAADGTVTVASGDVEPVALAGLVNAIMERALRRDFKLPVPPHDPFVKQYDELRNSSHPAWIDREMNQLRRDFLQFCGIIGSDVSDGREHESDRVELQEYGTKLIASLTGRATSGDTWKTAPDAIEVFAGIGPINERNKWREMFEESYLAGHDARDKISSLQNAMGGILGTDETGQLGVTRRKLHLAEIQYDMAKGELRRAWDVMREEIEGSLVNGVLTAKGFRVPHIVGRAEVEIAPAEWRVLTLNNVKSEALRKGSNEVLYSGLLIRKNG
jgi:hypothetical protein